MLGDSEGQAEPGGRRRQGGILAGTRVVPLRRCEMYLAGSTVPALRGPLAPRLLASGSRLDDIHREANADRSGTAGMLAVSFSRSGGV